MEPEYKDGDVIVISPNSPCKSGDDVVLMYNDEVTLKRIKYDNDSISIIPLNESYPILTLRGEQAKNIKIIGKVTELYKNKT